MDPYDDHQGRHLPIPDADDHRPAYNRQSSSFQDYDNPQRYSQYDDGHQDYVVDPEAHHDSYYHQPYEPSPQDVPLLPIDPVRNPFYDSSEDFRASRQSFQPPPSEPTPAPDQQRSNSYQEALEHWVYDCPVPPKMLRNVPHVEPPGRDEFTHMKYTAATCDPKDFTAERFQLRPQLFGVPRHTELMIVVTMYNEEDTLFGRTMQGVFKNIEYMCTLKDKHNGIWGPNGWKKIVVCIINDGRAQLNTRTRAVLTALGVYQHGFAFAKVNDKKVKAHIYEYTTRVNIKVKKGIVETTPGGLAVPVQLMFCLKEENQKKINSHRWAFSAFGEALKPNICILLDAGTRPGDQSIYELWKAFELDPNCGGACGEIKAMLGKDGKFEKLANPIVAAQNFEYKMSNILDKPMESAFGFISVLPGAFSAYRLVALQNDASGEGPLEKYFAGETNHETANIFTKNMYLAEDRILCFELVAKRKASWVLTYVCTASGETDVPEKMPELIKQRRRWLNGSFFAAVYALWHSMDIFRSSHTFTRKMMFLLEFFYQLIAMIFAWFAVGNFFLVFQILTTSLGDPNLLGRTGVILSVIVEWIYLGSLVACFVLSLGNTPDGSKRFYYSMVYSWGLIMIYLMFASIFITYKSVKAEAEDGHFTISKLVTNSIFFTLIVSLLSTYVLWIFISIVFMDPWHIVTSSIQYLLLSPTYTNVINVYAFCNTHDVSWGTKGPDVQKEEINGNAKAGKKADEELGYDDAELDDLYDAALQKFSTEYKEPEKEPDAKAQGEADTRSFRTNIVLVWMFCNAALVAIVLKTGGVNRLSLKQTTEGESQQVKIYLSVVLWSVAGLSGFKFIGAMWYKIKRIFKR